MSMDAYSKQPFDFFLKSGSVEEGGEGAAMIIVEDLQNRSLPRRDTISNSSNSNHQVYRWLVIFSALYIFLFARAMWGWGPMQLMLEKNGSFHYLCKEETTSTEMEYEVCPEQTARLLSVQMTGQLTILLSPLLGAIADRYGPSTLMNILGTSGTIGIALLIVAVKTGLDALLFAAFICLGLMAVSSTIMTVLTGLAFQGRSRARVISALNALFDAGSITYLGLWKIMDLGNYALTTIATAYLLVAFVAFGGGMYCWRIIASIKSRERRPIEDSTHTSDRCSNDEKEEVGVEESLSRKVLEDDYKKIASRPQCQQFISKLFISLTVYFSFYLSRNVFALTTARDFLGGLGDNETGNLYLVIFTFLMPASLCALPLVDIVLAKYGCHVGLQTVNVLALAHGLVQISTDSLRAQVAGFVAFTFFRCFIFAVVFSFMPTFLSPDAVGKGAGLLNLAGGICMFTNIPLAYVSVSMYDSFFLPNLLYTVPVIPMFYITFLMGQWAKRDSEAK